MEKSCDKGFGLLEFMIAMAISAFVALGLASIFNMIQSNSTNLQGSTGAQSLRSTLMQVTSSLPLPNVLPVTTSCFGHLIPGPAFDVTKAQAAGFPLGFYSNDGTPGNIPSGTQIFGYDPNGPKLTPTVIPNYNVSVRYLAFRKDPNTAPVGPDPNGITLYLGTLVAGVTKSTATIGGQDLPEMSVVSLYLAIDSGLNIKNCYNQPVSGTDANQACIAMGGLYYPGSVPPCQIPYPCQAVANTVFTGYDPTGLPICTPAASLTAQTCNAGQTIEYNGTGWVCVP